MGRGGGGRILAHLSVWKNLEVIRSNSTLGLTHITQESRIKTGKWILFTFVSRSTMKLSSI